MIAQTGKSKHKEKEKKKKRNTADFVVIELCVVTFVEIVENNSLI
jgi:hypothetical protein